MVSKADPDVVEFVEFAEFVEFVANAALRAGCFQGPGYSSVPCIVGLQKCFPWSQLCMAWRDAAHARKSNYAWHGAILDGSLDPESRFRGGECGLCHGGIRSPPWRGGEGECGIAAFTPVYCNVHSGWS